MPTMMTMKLPPREIDRLTVELPFPLDDDNTPPPSPADDRTPDTPTYFAYDYTPLPLRQYPFKQCLNYLISYAQDNPVQDTLKDIPAHDILDAAIYLDSPILRDRWAYKLLTNMTLYTAADTVLALLKQYVMTPLPPNTIPEVISQAIKTIGLH